MNTASRRRRSTATLACAVVIGLAMTACAAEAPTTAPSASTAPKAGGTLTVGLQQAPDNLDPNVASGAIDFRVTRQVFDNLVFQDDKGKIGPWLADSWDVSDDAQTYTFHLHKGVKFHDGTDFDAKAVCFNFDRIVAPETASRLAASLIGPYESCTAEDASTAVVKLKSAFTPFLSNLAGYVGMVSPTAVEKEGNEKFALNPVGTGPFSFVSYEVNSKIILKKNPDYDWAPPAAKHSGAAYLDEIEFQIAPDDTPRIGSVTAGQLLSAESVPAQMVAGIKADSNLELDSIGTAGAPYALFLNQQHAPWDDLKARQAVRYALDVDAITSTIYLGAYPRAWGPISPPTVGYDDSVEGSWKTNIEKANSLLDSLGWKLGADKIREKDGKKLTVTYLEQSPNRDKRQDVAQFVAQSLAQIGIQVTTSFVPTAAWTAAAQQGNYDIAGGSLGGTDGSVMQRLYGSTNQPTPEKLGFNLSHVNSPELDKWLADAQHATDVSQSNKLYAQAQEYINKNALSIPIYVNTYLFVHRSNVHQIAYNSVAHPIFYDTYIN